jgi:nitroimidazol reductase NimA-like FMN-containing flavoprotein (pyridoxamine 5'-phosphate oxidase superfamily)/ribosomal protein S18 acetylase RimI-like enzyme
MRKEIFRMPDVDARAMLAAAKEMTFSAVGRSDAGAPVPILRTVNTWMHDDALYFHGAPAGEKMDAMGGPAVFETARVVARLPSYFVDPERACPATTLYEGVQAHGTLHQVTVLAEKTRAIAGLMQKLQPEGGYVPLSAPMYEKTIAGMLVARMQIERIDGKRKVCQNRSPKERTRIVEQLFVRGDAGDAEAIETIFAHNQDTPVPTCMQAPGGGRFSARLPSPRHAEALALLRQGAYWLLRTPDETVLRSMDAPAVMVGAFDAAYRLVAVARIVADARVAWLYDVMVDPRLQRTGLGRSLMDFVLAHPMVRRADKMRLTTRDADGFYRKLGFRTLDEAPRHPWPSIDMIRHASPP